MVTGARLDPPLDMLKRILQAGLTDSMLEHLWSHRNRKCGNDKDRIFAIRALCTESERSGILVEYRLAVEKLFTKCTRGIITRSGSLNILGTRLPLERKHSSLPSWSNSEARRPMRIFTSVTSRIQGVSFAALPGTTASVDEVEDDMNDVLTTNGYHAQTISQISLDRTDTECCSFSCPEVLGSVLNDFCTVAEKLTAAQDINWLTANTTVDGPDEGLIVAFRRTLIANRDRFSQRDPNRVPGQGEALFSAIVQSISGRRFFVTEGSDMGLGPHDVWEGAHICLLPGAVIPFVLRSDIEHQDQTNTAASAFPLVGECYCHTLVENVDGRKLSELHRVEIW